MVKKNTEKFQNVWPISREKKKNSNANGTSGEVREALYFVYRYLMLWYCWFVLRQSRKYQSIQNSNSIFRFNSLRRWFFRLLSWPPWKMLNDRIFVICQLWFFLISISDSITFRQLSSRLGSYWVRSVYKVFSVRPNVRMCGFSLLLKQIEKKVSCPQNPFCLFAWL